MVPPEYVGLTLVYVLVVLLAFISRRSRLVLKDGEWHARLEIKSTWVDGNPVSAVTVVPLGTADRTQAAHVLRLVLGEEVGPLPTPQLQVARLWFREAAIRLVLEYPETAKTIRSWLARLNVPDVERDDLAQEISVRALESLATYDPRRADLLSWLHGIAVHVAADHRTQRQREDLTEDMPDTADIRPNAEESIVDEQEHLELLTLLQEVTLEVGAEFVSILVAHDVDGIPMQELADVRHVPVSTLYKHRALALSVARELARKRPHPRTAPRTRQHVVRCSTTPRRLPALPGGFPSATGWTVGVDAVIAWKMPRRTDATPWGPRWSRGGRGPLPSAGRVVMPRGA